MDRFCVGALAAGTAVLFGCSTQVFNKDSLFSYRDESYSLSYYLPATRISVEVLKNKDPKATPRYGILIDPSKSVSYPDTNAVRKIAYRPDSLSDDDLCISRTPTGLLSLVSFTAADRSGDVIVSLAEIAAMAATGMPKMPSGVNTKAFTNEDPYVKQALEDFIGTLSRENSNVIYSALFDPIKSGTNDETKNVNEDVNNILQAELNSLVYSLAFKGEHEKALPGCQSSVKKENPKKSAEQQNVLIENCANKIADTRAMEHVGTAQSKKMDVTMTFDRLPPADPTLTCKADKGEICHRTYASVPMTIEYNKTPIFRGQVAVLNKDADEGMPVYRARLVEKVTSLSFTDGVLTGVSLQAPSQMKALARLPITVAGAVLEAPASFFTAIARGFQSQTQAVEAKAKMMMALAELEKAKNGQTASPGSTTPTGEPEWTMLNADTANKMSNSGACSVGKPK